MKPYLTIIAFLILIASIYALYANKPEKQIIYIYNDKGVSAESVRHTKRFFQTMTNDSYTVAYLNAKDLLQADWVKDAALFVIPGGADTFYVNKLRGKGDKIIQKYIRNGGSFLGICAGSYYASSFVEFDKGGPDEVVGARQLNLVNSHAIGPVLAKYSYSSNKGARAAVIQCDQDKLAVFYNGGPYFQIPKNNTTAKIICTYSEKDNLPAVVYSKYGKGQVLLSAVHFEYDPNKLSHNDEYYRKIIATLNSDNKNRISFGNKILKLLKI